MTKLEQLRRNLMEEQDSSNRLFTYSQLEDLLNRNNGDVNAASYEGLLQKAQSDGVTLPDGAHTSDGRSYWLSLARLYRPSGSGTVPRADEVMPC